MEYFTFITNLALQPFIENNLMKRNFTNEINLSFIDVNNLRNDNSSKKSKYIIIWIDLNLISSNFYLNPENIKIKKDLIDYFNSLYDYVRNNYPNSIIINIGIYHEINFYTRADNDLVEDLNQYIQHNKLNENDYFIETDRVIMSIGKSECFSKKNMIRYKLPFSTYFIGIITKFIIMFITIR